MFFGLKNGIVMDVIGTFGSSGSEIWTYYTHVNFMVFDTSIFFVLLVYYLSEFIKGCNVCVLHE